MIAASVLLLASLVRAAVEAPPRTVPGYAGLEWGASVKKAKSVLPGIVDADDMWAWSRKSPPTWFVSSVCGENGSCPGKLKLPQGVVELVAGKMRHEKAAGGTEVQRALLFYRGKFFATAVHIEPPSGLTAARKELERLYGPPSELGAFQSPYAGELSCSLARWDKEGETVLLFSDANLKKEISYDGALEVHASGDILKQIRRKAAELSKAEAKKPKASGDR